MACSRSAWPDTYLSAVRLADAYSMVLDGWLVDAWELALCAMVFYRVHAAARAVAGAEQGDVIVVRDVH